MSTQEKNGLLRLVNLVIKASGFISYACMVVMMLLIISDPFMRYMVGMPFYWSNEVSTFLMVAMAYTGLAIVFVKGGHVRVTLIFDRLPQRIRNVLWIIIASLAMFYIGILTYAVARLARVSFEVGRVTPTAELPYYPWQVLVVLGLIVFALVLLIFTINRLLIAFGVRKEDDIQQLITIE
jgi:TRAP-type C4-dicarboxylate transport system permease small subunit